MRDERICRCEPSLICSRCRVWMDKYLKYLGDGGYYNEPPSKRTGEDVWLSIRSFKLIHFPLQRDKNAGLRHLEERAKEASEEDEEDDESDVSEIDSPSTPPLPMTSYGVRSIMKKSTYAEIDTRTLAYRME